MGSTSHKTKQTKAAEKGCQYPTRNGDTQTKNSIFQDAEFHSNFIYSGPVNIITFNMHEPSDTLENTCRFVHIQTESNCIETVAK